MANQDCLTLQENSIGTKSTRPNRPRSCSTASSTRCLVYTIWTQRLRRIWPETCSSSTTREWRRSRRCWCSLIPDPAPFTICGISRWVNNHANFLFLQNMTSFSPQKASARISPVGTIMRRTSTSCCSSPPSIPTDWLRKRLNAGAATWLANGRHIIRNTRKRSLPVYCAPYLAV